MFFPLLFLLIQLLLQPLLVSLLVPLVSLYLHGLPVHLVPQPVVLHQFRGLAPLLNGLQQVPLCLDPLLVQGRAKFLHIWTILQLFVHQLALLQLMVPVYKWKLLLLLLFVVLFFLVLFDFECLLQDIVVEH